MCLAVRTFTRQVVHRGLAVCGAVGLCLSVGCQGEIQRDSSERAPDQAGTIPQTSSNASTDPRSGMAGQAGARDPGRVTLHRLNRAEYDNTVRDLLGTDLRPAADFPTDDRGHGYDNIADVLSLSPLQIELYFGAAEALAAEALRQAQVGARRFEAAAMVASVGVAYGGSAWNLYSNGSVEQVVDIPAPGEYRIAVRAWQQPGGPDAARMSIDLDGSPVKTAVVMELAASPGLFEHRLMLKAGPVRVGASFLNDFYDPGMNADRNLIVDWVEVEGPIGAMATNAIRERIMVCKPDAARPGPCLRQIVQRFGRRAWRRPLQAGEIDALVGLAEASIAAGDDLDSAVKLVMRALLVSPHFIFRVEIDPDPTSPKPHPVSDHELASRLSYFLWSSMPDDTLLDLADGGQLGKEDVLRAQVRRVLADGKARALLDNFAGQWLFTRAFEDHEPDYRTFPTFDKPLRGSMRKGTELFAGELLAGREPLDRLLTADFTFIDDRLARHYGLPAVGEGFKRVALTSGERQGLLGQAGILMVTSFPTRTSPVKRGKWVMTQLLCTPPPDPPPGVEGFEEQQAPTASLRERLEQHRSKPICGACHETMDAIGFGLEHYDGIGAFRTKDGAFDVDARGTLPNGASFDGLAQLNVVLASNPQFPACVAAHVFTYALGRAPGASDGPSLEAAVAGFLAGGRKLPDLFERMVLSEPFRMRRGEPEGKGP